MKIQRIGLSCWLLLALPTGAVAQTDGAGCQDPVFLQFEARMSERTSLEAMISGWREFVTNYPHNPCVGKARERVVRLSDSVRAVQERKTKSRWRQEARGGLIEPGRGLMPVHSMVNDPASSNHVRWLSEVIWLSDLLAEEMDVAPVVWTQVLRLEYAPVSRLAVSLDVPIVVGEPHSAGFDLGLGNIRLGIRAIWGMWLSESRPLVLAAGFQWSSGSSVWSGEELAGLLDAAAFGGAHFMPMYRWDARDYAGHAQAQIGLGAHHLSVGLLYRLQVGGEHVEKMARLDLAWDWNWSERWQGVLECIVFGGTGEDGASATQNDWLLYVLPSAGVSRQIGGWRLATALRIPMLDAGDWGRVSWVLEVRRDF